MKDKIRVALYGGNGHQIHNKLINHPNAQLVAVCALKESQMETVRGEKPKEYETLTEMLKDEEVDLVSLCSPMRSEQARDAILCLKAGKHVYSEKPAALSEKELDEILEVSKETGCEFHEYADTIFYEPYWSMKNLVQSGKIGEVVQVYVQKSYPLNAALRPQDEETDGGLIRWVGIHAIRFIEHITGVKVSEAKVFQTHKGNIDESSGLFTASSWAMKLENGGVASACVNYLHPKRGFGQHGNESVRIFGTEGMAEITDGARNSHLYTRNEDMGEIDTSNSSCRDFFDLYIEHLLFGNTMPMSLEDELHPLRVVIRAFDSATTVRKEADGHNKN